MVELSMDDLSLSLSHVHPGSATALDLTLSMAALLVELCDSAIAPGPSDMALKLSFLSLTDDPLLFLADAGPWSPWDSLRDDDAVAPPSGTPEL